MKPGRRIPASNAAWTGGPDIGTATKVPTAAGDLADGRYRGIRPAPQLDNFEDWAVASRLDRLASAKLLNIIDEPVAAAGWSPAWLARDMAGCGAPAGWTYPARHDTIIMRDAAGPPYLGRGIRSYGGRNWNAATLGWCASVSAPRLTVDDTTIRAHVVGVVAVADVPYFSAGLGVAWAVWGGGTPAGQFTAIDWGTWAGVGYYAIGDGVAGTVLISTAPGVAFAAPATPPGFAGGVTVIANKHHAPGDIYPDDPGSHGWVALTGTQCSVTSHATLATWTVAAAHGMGGSFPADVGYSKVGGKWVCICTGVPAIFDSPDGLTWTILAAGIPTSLAAATEARIATDGFGHWTAVLVDGGTGVYELFISSDDAETWIQVWPAVVIPAILGGDVWYSDGHFIWVVGDGAGAGAIYSTLRSVDD